MWRLVVHVAVATSHRRTDESREPESSEPPSAESAIADTLSSWPRMVATASSSPRLHSRTVVSREADAAPPADPTCGAAITRLTPRSWPRQRCTTDALPQLTRATARSSPQLRHSPGPHAVATPLTSSSCGPANDVVPPVSLPNGDRVSEMPEALVAREPAHPIFL